MSRDDIEIRIHREKRNTHSVDDQVTLAHRLWESGELPDSEGITRSDAEEMWESGLEHSVRTCLHHLEEADIVEASRKPGPETYVIADWDGESIVNGFVDEVAAEAIEVLVDHVQDEDPPESGDTSAVADGAGVTLRQIVAEQFDLEAESLEGYLRSGDQVEKLNGAVDGIEGCDKFSTRDDYGRIQFVNAPYQYRLTSLAVELYER